MLMLLGLGFLKAQPQAKRIYQLSGLVVNKGSQDPVPFAKVQINHSRRGIVCNQEGFYSIPVIASDTLFFSSIGYKTTQFVVKDYLESYAGDPNSAYIYAINYLREDSILLPSIVIFPYNTSMELRTAIVETKVPEAFESVNARDNLNPQVMDKIMSTLSVDEGERVMTARQLYYNQYLHRNVMPTVPLFDPIAAYQLLRYINDKVKQRKEDNLNYWND
jgi:CarboxypepD_reg-like domain